MGSGFWVLGFGFWALGFGFWVLDLGFGVLDFWSWALGFGFLIFGFGVLGSYAGGPLEAIEASELEARWPEGGFSCSSGNGRVQC